MPIIDDVLIEKLCFLSKLSFDHEEKESMKKDLNMVLALVEKINELPTDDLEPLIHMTKEINRYREDKVENTITKAEALSNAPQSDSDYFRVPKFVEKG